MAYPPLLPPGYLAATGGTDLLESCSSDLVHGSRLTISMGWMCCSMRVQHVSILILIWGVGGRGLKEGADLIISGSPQMEIRKAPVVWAPDAWDLLNRRLSFSGTLKRGRVSVGVGGEHDLVRGRL
jgi:hypothetical protein